MLFHASTTGIFSLRNQRPTKAVGGRRRGVPELILEVETEICTLLGIQHGEIKGKHDCSVWKGLSSVGTILSTEFSVSKHFKGEINGFEAGDEKRVSRKE